MNIKKVCIMIIHQLKQVIKEKKLLFLLVILSVSVSTFGVFFYADYLACYAEKMSGQQGDCLLIESHLKKEDTKKIKQVLKQLDDSEINHIICSDVDAGKVESDSEIFLKGEYHKNYEERLLIGRLPEWKSEKREIVIDEFTAENLNKNISPIGQKINIDDKDFNVIGVCSITEEDEMIVPIAFYLDNFTTNKIQISFCKELLQDEKERVSELFTSRGIKVIWKSRMHTWINMEFWKNIWEIVAVFLLISINNFMLMRYLVIRNRKKYCVYSICGGTRRNISGIISVQTFIPIWLGTLIGFFLILIANPFLQKYEWLKHEDSGITYTIILGLLLVIEVVVCGIFKKVMINKVELYYVEE